MKKQTIFYLIVSLLILSGCTNTAKKSSLQISLNNAWEFRAEGNRVWLPASVPGCVHTDLLTLELIPDPYFGTNEDSVQWVSQKVWEYRTHFCGDSFLKKYRQLELVFEGIDTQAEIFLNGEKINIGAVDNMFRTWRFEVSDKLNEGENELLVKFYPVIIHNQNEAEKLPYTLPDNRVFSRKAPYQFGWDWGPTLVTCGLWKPVYILAWNDFKIENQQLIQKFLSDEFAELEMVLEVIAENKTVAELSLKSDEQILLTEKNIVLQEGKNIIRKNFIIHNPERWNPNGLGAQKLYAIETTLQTNAHYARTTEKIGLRTIELVREKDSIGESFTFHINGKPVFMKGANYIPQDNFTTRVTPERYRKLLTATKDANMNMLRVWGGGVYEDDYFYDLCDSLGILIWQDFMFACALYPGDSAFLSTVRHEAEEQVKRLRNHACIALWCGNNEVKNGWEDWGWQRQYSETDREKIWRYNQEIFENILPEIVGKYDEKTPYHISSPEWGWGHDECVTSGDSHYWGVWWGEEPFEVWEAKTGRFMSEYGFQAMPTFSTIESFTFPEDRSLQSAAVKAHQKHSRGYELIEKYMQRDYFIPQDFFHYAYVSQLLQANGVGQAFEIHRRRKPHCMGTLYWQLNDCWQVTSWSSLDAKYQWKALHYAAREKFKPILLTVFPENDELSLHLVSDLQQSVKGKVSVVWQDLFGKVLDEEIIELEVPENISMEFLRIPKAKYSNRFNDSHLVLRFADEDGNTAENIYYFARQKELKLPEYRLNISVSQVDKNFHIQLLSDALVKNLYLYTNENSTGFFSNNYFDLLPNEPKTIIYTPNEKITLDEFEKQLKTLSLKDVK